MSTPKSSLVKVDNHEYIIKRDKNFTSVEHIDYWHWEIPRLRHPEGTKFRVEGNLTDDEIIERIKFYNNAIETGKRIGRNNLQSDLRNMLGMDEIYDDIENLNRRLNNI